MEQNRSCFAEFRLRSFNGKGVVGMRKAILFIISMAMLAVAAVAGLGGYLLWVDFLAPMLGIKAV
jgi:hypothetical protein